MVHPNHCTTRHKNANTLLCLLCLLGTAVMLFRGFSDEAKRHERIWRQLLCILQQDSGVRRGNPFSVSHLDFTIPSVEGRFTQVVRLTIRPLTQTTSLPVLAMPSPESLLFVISDPPLPGGIASHLELASLGRLGWSGWPIQSSSPIPKRIDRVVLTLAKLSVA